MDLAVGRGLVQRWRTGGRRVSPAAPGPTPVSLVQRGILVFERLRPDTSVFNLCFAARHAGRIDEDRLDGALATLLRRHPALCSTFADGDAGPVRVVRDAVDLTTQWTELRRLPPGQRLAAAREHAGRFAAEPFDLDRGPLVRVHGCRLAEDERLLVFVAHHLVCDGVSLQILLNELDAAYHNELSGRVPEAAPPQVGEAALAYWRTQLAELPELDLPTDRGRPAQPTFRAGSVPLTVPNDLVDAAGRLGRAENATLFMVVLAAFQLLLAEYSGQTDFAVGSPEAGRVHPGRHGAVGLLSDLMVLRADLTGRPSFRDLVQRARDTCLAAFAHRGVPFEEVVAALAPGRHVDAAVVRAGLVFHGERQEWTLAGSPLEPVAVTRPGLRYDVELHLWREQGPLRGSWDYSAEAFEPATATRMAERLPVLLYRALAEPDRPVDQLDLLTDDERVLLRRWGNGPAPAHPDGGLHELFAAQAARTPEAVAVSDSRRELTYRQLDERSNQLAHHLRGRAVDVGDVVGIRLGRSVDLAVAMLGILKAGAAYLPLDPAYPADRIEYMMGDSAARTVVTDADLSNLDGQPTSPVDGSPVPPDRLAYVLYTSGSTGLPKGVMLTHGNAVPMVLWGQRVFAPDQMSRVLASTSICFDVSVFEFFVPLCAGGTVVVVDNALSLLADPPDVTMVSVVPSAAKALVAAHALPPSVRVVGLGGEAVTGTLVDDLYATGHVEAVMNLYGPTEDTTYSTYARLLPEEQPPPVGVLLPHERGYVLDPALRPVPVGVVGELYLAGRGLSRGYVNKPGLTAARYVVDPFSSAPGERMYRTGDLVRYRSDGSLLYLGRRDFQVKVRGQRIELGEIETTLQRHPGVREAVVSLHGDRLVGYLTARRSAGPDLDDVRAYLRRTLPVVMVPSSLVVLDTLPQTPNGKVDRGALPAPDAPEGTDGAPPRGPDEELVAEVWRQVLELDTVGRDDDFFDLGGDSLRAGQVLNRLRQRAGVGLPMRLVFEHSRLADLAAALPAADHANPAIAVAARRPGPGGAQRVDATLGHRTLWFFSQLDPAAHRAYVIQGALRLTGPVRAEALDRAIHAVALRHETLRTTFEEVDGQLEQVIHAEPQVALERVALADEAALPALAEAVSAGFDLVAGPLLRVHLAELGDERHILLLTVHHIVADGWSLALLADEISQAYAALSADRPPELPALPVQYADYTAWQNEALRSGSLDHALEHWCSRLADLPPLELRSDRVRPPRPSYDGALVNRSVPAEVAHRLHAVATEHTATPYMVLLAVFLVLLHRHSGQRDIAVGTPVAGRSRGELERLIGFFLNTVVVRAEVRAEDAFPDLLQRVRRTSLDALSHQDVPLEAILDQLRPARDPSRSQLFQAMFNYLNQPAARFRAPGLVVEEIATPRLSTKVDLELYVEDRPDGSVELALSYSRDLFEPDTAAAMLDRYVNLLRQVADTPEVSVTELRLGPPGDRQEAPRGGAAPAANETVATRFAARVARHPRREAIWTPDTALTYRDLDERARRVAAALHEQVPVAQGRAGILCAQGVQAPLAMLGIMAAGHGYVPLDTQAPAARLAELVTATAADAILTDPQHRALAEQVAAGRPVIDVLEASTRPLAPVPRWPAIDPDAPAYVLFTSGSTGEPKAVVQSHRNVLKHVVAYLSELDVDASDRLTMLCSYTADGAGQDLYSALLTGATACPMDLRGDGVHAVRAALQDSGATIYHSNPTAFRKLAAATGCAGWPDTLHTVVLGGETLTREDISQVREHLPACRTVNVYGLTECSIMLMHTVDPDDTPSRDIVPIGHAVPGIEFHLRDEDGQPSDLHGELVCTGPGLAAGYLDPAQTAAAFQEGEAGRSYATGDLVRQLPDGTFEYLGRRDGQVKLRGYRVETGEVEARLRGCPGVDDAAVVPVTDPDGEPQLAGYVTGTAEPAQLRVRLRSLLPYYMVPAAIVPVAQLPTTRTGKLDRAALPPPDWSAIAGSAPPRTPTEQAIADVMSAVLGVARVGRQDDFFELGGESLQATKVAGQLREVLDVDLAVRDIFELGTPERLAAAMPPRRPAVSPRPADAAPVLSFDQQRLWLECQLRPNVAYNVHGRQWLRGPLDVAVLQRSIQAIITRHETLRTTFPLVDGQPVQRVAEPDSRWRITMADLSTGGSGAAAAAERLADDQAATSFDLAEGPLFDCLLVRLGDTDHLLSVTIHHIIADAWSVGRFLRELSALYRVGGEIDRAGLPELPVQYRDYAAWQRTWLTSERLTEQVGYWRDRLAGAPPAPNLPISRRRLPSQGVIGGRVRAELGADGTAALRGVCREQGATPFMAMLASLAAMLRRWSGQDDLVIGVPVTTRGDAGTEDLIGFFVNTLPLRVGVAGAPAFTELLRRARQAALDAYARHADTPFDVLVRELQVARDPSRTPLFQVSLNMIDSAEDEWQLPGISLETSEKPALPSKFDLNLNVLDHGGTLQFELYYHADRYEAATMQAFLDQLTALLSAVAADPARGILEYELRSAAVSAPVSGTTTQVAPPMPHLALERHARQRADRIAVVDGDGSWTYRQLAGAAARVAGILADRGPGAGEVGVVKRRAAGFAAAVLGCGRAAVPYTVIEPDGPPHQLSTVLDPYPAEGVVDVRALLRESQDSSHPGAEPDVPLDDRTGDWALERFGLTGDDRVAVLTGDPDLLVSALSTAASAGATLMVADSATAEDPDVLVKWLQSTSATVIYLAPPLLRRLPVHDNGPALPSLRYAFVDNGGDLIARDVEGIQRLAPGCRVVGVYRVTRTGRPLACYEVPAAWSSATAPLRVPIGTEVAGTAEVLNPAGRAAGVGEIGELCFGALRTGDLVRRRPDRLLEFAGHPARGELSGAPDADPLEIVAAMRDLPDVQDALVTEYLDLDGLPAAAAYIACPGDAVDLGNVRQHLVTHLPEYLVPQHLVPLERLPLTPDGDYDLAALPEAAGDGARVSSYVAPRTPIERQLISIFEELLKTERVGIHDTFFELNGFSLLATQLASRIRETFDVDLSLRDVFESPTVESLAQLIVRTQLEAADADQVRALLDELE